MKYLIIGGTGTLGQELSRQLLEADKSANITIFSRDELKQQHMAKDFPSCRYVIGDIRDQHSVREVVRGVDVVFLVAALKHVDVLENNPKEAIKTNIIGTINVAEEAIAAGVRHVVFSSTDKSVLPVNVYGMTKGIAERYLLDLNRKQTSTKFSVFKWCNVIGSRGSVVHSFVKSLLSERKVYITDVRMTRLWIRIQDAVRFMLSTYETAPTDDICIPEMKASTVVRLAESVARCLGFEQFEVETIGVRPGEKIHETIISTHSKCVRSDNSPQFTNEELDALVAPVVAGDR